MLEKAKEIAAQVKETKRRLGVMNPMNERAQPNLYEAQLPPRKIDIIIVGGGIMGSSIAYHLTKNDLGAGVLVIEKDPMVSCCSSLRRNYGFQYCVPPDKE